VELTGSGSCGGSLSWDGSARGAGGCHSGSLASLVPSSQKTRMRTETGGEKRSQRRTEDRGSTEGNPNPATCDVTALEPHRTTTRHNHHTTLKKKRKKPRRTRAAQESKEKSSRKKKRKRPERRKKSQSRRKMHACGEGGAFLFFFSFLFLFGCCACAEVTGRVRALCGQRYAACVVALWQCALSVTWRGEAAPVPSGVRGAGCGGAGCKVGAGSEKECKGER
jgi:hypothetical protein